MKCNCVVVLFFCLYIFNSVKGDENECYKKRLELREIAREMLENKEIDEECKEYTVAMVIYQDEEDRKAKMEEIMKKFRSLPQDEQKKVEECAYSSFAKGIERIPVKPSEECKKEMVATFPYKASMKEE